MIAFELRKVRWESAVFAWRTGVDAGKTRIVACDTDRKGTFYQMSLKLPLIRSQRAMEFERSLFIE
jgi:hypothetical protein